MKRNRGTTLWGLAALALAAFTSVYAAGFVVVTHSVSASHIRVSVASTAPDSTPTTIPPTLIQPATPRPTTVPAPSPILPIPHRSTTHAGWTVGVLFAVLLLVASVPLLARRSRFVQPVRVWTAVLFGVGVVVTVQSFGLLFVPTLGALVMAARTGRHPLRATTGPAHATAGTA